MDALLTFGAACFGSLVGISIALEVQKERVKMSSKSFSDRDYSFKQTPHKRTDSELYDRPPGDSKAFRRGYADGVDNRTYDPYGTLKERADYIEGFTFGQDERDVELGPDS